MSTNDEYLNALIHQYDVLDRENTSLKRGPMDTGPYEPAMEHLNEMICARIRELRRGEEGKFCLRKVILAVGGFLLQIVTFGRLDSMSAYRLAERLWKSGFGFLGLAWPDDWGKF